MITITTKNKEYNGITAGVQFKDGEAKVEALSPAVEAYMLGAGYTIDKGKKNDNKKDKDDGKKGEDNPKSKDSPAPPADKQ
ncbi:hypothetical protein [Acetanaerobacterium elongatum]|uniref:Uncharacterized protein n=1 Tax=Acetanaerobacterium elongatum TaxID=258515 RepID=A0A1G9Z312_9FIRM|nr:hypothetical protein [Acetanaerobacterium elongatum]SDN15056.1 hypothetical protein SAMN05192585_11255 [Acetanaerobacterium elongatum]